ncbi:MAG: hypothetical protein GY719_31145 [bacterium]|nr:hypothetical protein [bacterium]
MTVLLLFLVITFLALPATVAAEEWIQSEVFGLDTAPPPSGEVLSCARLWIEERTWRFDVTGTNLSGIFGSNIRTLPLATTGPSCRFDSQAPMPLAFTVRMWNIERSRHDKGVWDLQLVPAGEMTGVPLNLKHGPFSTRLFMEGDRLVDTATNAGASKRLIFRRPAAPPPDLADAVRRTLEGLHTGQCMKIMSATVDPPEALEKVAPALSTVCDLRRRMLNISGSLVSVSIGHVTTIDRVVAPLVRSVPTDGWSTKKSYLVELTMNYERSRVPGTALFTKENESWRLVRLW